jgi:hypothetical protein
MATGSRSVKTAGETVAVFVDRMLDRQLKGVPGTWQRHRAAV